MTASGNKPKKPIRKATSSKKPVKPSTESKSEIIDPKILEEHHKKIHAAAKEAQNAVKKALENMADQVKYEEKYEE